MLVLFWVVGRLPRSSTCDCPSSSSQLKQNTKRCVLDGLAELGSFPSQMARGGHGIRGRVVGPGCRITRASEVWCQLQSGAECMLHQGGFCLVRCFWWVGFVCGCLCFVLLLFLLV